MSRKANFFPFLLLCLFFACTAKTPPRIALPENEQQNLLKTVERYIQSLQKIKGVKAYAKVRLKVRGQKINFDEVIKIQFPFSFYFETLDDLANTSFQLMSDGSSLFWQDFIRKEYWEGELNEKSIRKFIPLASDLEETLGLFVGKIPPLDLKEAKVFKNSDSSQYIIRIPRGEIIWDLSQNAIVHLALKGEGASLAFEYEGGRFHPQTLNPTKETDVNVPSHVKLKDLKTKNEIEINYKDLTLGIGPMLVPLTIQFNPLPDAKRLNALP